MKTTAYLCDRCKEPVNGKGYSASIDENFSPVGMDILCGIDPAYDHHYCGRQCLMIVLNERVDAMEKAEDVPASPARTATPFISPLRKAHPYTERRGAA